jgi:hypothetical protein
LERRILLRALFLLPVTGAALHTFGFRLWKTFLTKFTPKNSDVPVTPESLQSARRTARMVAAASQEGIFHGKCLERSIVLWWFLLCRGFPAELRIGARQSEKGFEAHAWVEVQGNIVNDTEAVRNQYSPFGNNVANARVEHN